MKPAIRTALAAAAALLVVLFVQRVPADDSRVVSIDDAITMMNALPAKELDVNGPPFKWSHRGQANRVAEAVSAAAGTSEQGAYLVVYDVYEANNVISAVGDGGKSHGPWQLSEDQAKPEVAHDPNKAAPIWLAIADKSRRDCARLPEDEQLAELASGNCDAGRELARRRAKLVRRALAALATAKAK
jgi:hypothetical protein